MNAQTPEERLAEVLDAHGCEYGVCACGEAPASLAKHQAAVVLAHLTAEGWAQGEGGQQ